MQAQPENGIRIQAFYPAESARDVSGEVCGDCVQEPLLGKPAAAVAGMHCRRIVVIVLAGIALAVIRCVVAGREPGAMQQIATLLRMLQHEDDVRPALSRYKKMFQTLGAEAVGRMFPCNTQQK